MKSDEILELEDYKASESEIMNIHQHEHIETSFANENLNPNNLNFNKLLENNSQLENQQVKNLKKLKKNAGHQIILILEEYHIHLEKFLKVLDEYLHLNKPL